MGKNVTTLDHVATMCPRLKNLAPLEGISDSSSSGHDSQIDLHPVETATPGRASRVTDIETVVDVDVQVPLVLVVGAVLNVT